MPHRLFMLMKMSGAMMWWLQSTSGLQDGSQKRNHPLHSQITVISTHIHKRRLGIDRYSFAACDLQGTSSHEQQ